MLTNDFPAMQRTMRRVGVRRLLVLSGEAHWAQYQAATLSGILPGDWLWISELASAGFQSVRPGAIRSLLGREYLHAVFDARDGLNVEALAILAGMLQAGSWLLLLVPSWTQWPLQADQDSLRWSEQATAIATPHFIHHLQQCLQQDSEVAIWRQGTVLQVPMLMARPAWRPPTGEATSQQRAILQQLRQMSQGVGVVTAARGRGKSTLAGMLIAHWPGRCWVTAPTKSATDILMQHAGALAEFYAPDDVLERCRQALPTAVEWLLIDEAAAIPLPQLRALLAYFPRVLMTTTVQGYEGSGRGFLLKFCASLPAYRHFNLSQPIRWAADDVLERVVDNLLLQQVEEGASPGSHVTKEYVIRPCQQQEWLQQPQRLLSFYALLTRAHYRTTPLDLRRILDAPGMHFSAASCTDVEGNEQIIGALWAVDEGGLAPELAHEIWAGRRRPRGNLVAQSLAAHSGQWQAAILRSRRISRIAVVPEQRRRGIARALIAELRQRAQQQSLDFLSVSFGYTDELWQFWQDCGFTLVRLGTHLEASSGCYAAMALLPLSTAGDVLRQQAHRRLCHEGTGERQGACFPLITAVEPCGSLLAEEWRELSGFAFAHRPFSVSLPAIRRLLQQSSAEAAMLRFHLEQQQTVAQTVAHFCLSGYRGLLQQWRQEVAQLLLQLDAALCEQWQCWSRVGGKEPDGLP